MNPRLFISHASGGAEPGSRVAQIRDELFELLKHEWTVFLDRERLAPGDRWRAEILASLAAAQAGIILFDRRAATASTWVPAEAMMLCFKKAVDPSFQLVPVLLDGQAVSDDAFKRYEPFQLSEVQAQRDDTTVAAGAVARQIVARVDPKQAASTGGLGWIESARALIKDDDRALRLAADELDIDHASLPVAGTANQTLPVLRHAVLQHLHQHEELGRCGSVFRALMQPMLAEERERFAGYIEAKWVPNPAIETLLRAGRDPSQRGLVGLNSTMDRLVRIYTTRAGLELHPKTCELVGVSDGVGDDEESMYQATVKALWGHVAKGTIFDDDAGMDEFGFGAAPLHERFAEQRSPDVVILCRLPPLFAKHPKLIARLRDDFDSVVFLLTTAPADAPMLVARGATVLLPLLEKKMVEELARIQNELVSGKNAP